MVGVPFGLATARSPNSKPINIGMLTALNRPHELQVHLKGAVNNGCTRDEIVEAVLQTAVYCGMPAALDTMRHVKALFDELDGNRST